METSRNRSIIKFNETHSLSGVDWAPSPVNQTNIIDFVTIATLGNAIDFGDADCIKLK